MTDQNIPADKVRKIVNNMHRHAEHDTVRGTEEEYTRHFAALLEALLPSPPPPTLADMTLDEQDECAGMQADLAQGDRVVILDGTPDHDGWVRVLERGLDVYDASPEDVTPRPDLPRMEWPGTEKPAPAPALPGGWRLADHKDNGRVIVTNPTPTSDGRVYYVLPSADPLGFDWLFCDPAELTYIDQEADTADTVPPNTLAVGSAWGKTDALAQACRESERDQIIALDRAGDAYVWSEASEWWESVSPKSVNAPYTILHAGKKADQ